MPDATASDANPTRVVEYAGTAERETALVHVVRELLARYTAARIGIVAAANELPEIASALGRSGVATRDVQDLNADRATLGDVVAYLRLLVDADDASAFDRVLNVPARGIGVGARDEIDYLAQTTGNSKWAAATTLAATGDAVGRRIQGFLDVVNRMRVRMAELDARAIITLIVETTGYERLLASGKGRESLGRLLDDVAPSAERSDLTGRTAVEQLLTTVAAVAVQRIALASPDSAHLLQVDACVRVDVSDGSPMAALPSVLETVEVTAKPAPRVREAAAQRTPPSPELPFKAPDQSRSTARPNTVVSPKPRPVESLRPTKPSPVWGAPSNTSLDPFPVGSWVRHATYGDGMILSSEGYGDRLKLSVRFASGIRKKLIASVAGLTSINKR